MEIITRDQWGALPATRETADPAPEGGYAILEVHHTVTDERGGLAQTARAIQRDHQARGTVRPWFDIFYHGMVSVSGQGLEGREWRWSHGSQLDSLVVAAVGDFENGAVPPALMAGLADMAAAFIAAGALVADYTVDWHRARADRTPDPRDASACPGVHLIAELEHLPGGQFPRPQIEDNPGGVPARWDTPWALTQPSGAPVVDFLHTPVAAFVLDATGAVYAEPATAYRGGANNPVDNPGGNRFSRMRPPTPAERAAGHLYVLVNEHGDTFHYPKV
ncbi:MAG: hypothetical protein GY929_09045 [Actinomycetia bacterium]|nr:hypothetical protein [Actinomycetes bacterium]